MAAKLHYSMIIKWSDEDSLFIVQIPEFEGAVTHGKTYEKAVKMGIDLIETFVYIYKEDGVPLPSPNKYHSEELSAEG